MSFKVLKAHDFAEHFHANHKQLIQENFSAKQTKCQGY